MPNHIKVRIKGSNETYLFKNGESIESIGSILDMHVRNKSLNKEMSFAQQGPEKTENIEKVNQYVSDVVSGKIALDGLKRLNDLNERMANGDTDAGIELAMEFMPAGLGTISKVDLFSKILKEKHGLSNLSISESGDAISLNMIKVPESERRSGIASRAMDDLIKYADSQRKTVKLHPESPEVKASMSKSNLIKFYKKHGFVENKGKNKDYEISEGMYRLPKVADNSLPIKNLGTQKERMKE